MSAPTVDIARSDYYVSLIRRVDAWRETAYKAARKEAETRVGQPYHGCIWHNADIAYGTPRQWADWGKAQHDAARWYAWRSGCIAETSARLTSALWAKACAARGWGVAA